MQIWVHGMFHAPLFDFFAKDSVFLVERAAINVSKQVTVCFKGIQSQLIISLLSKMRCQHGFDLRF